MLFANVELAGGDGSSDTPHYPKHALMEDYMNDVTQVSPDVTPRREFFVQAGGAVALGLAAFAATPLGAQTPSSDWPGALKGRYRQVVESPV
jgi:hypothetical protein